MEKTPKLSDLFPALPASLEGWYLKELEKKQYYPKFQKRRKRPNNPLL